MMLSIAEADARDWFETYGIANTPWNDYDDFQKEMLALEAIVDNWENVIDIRESGIPESNVLLYFYPEDVGLETRELEAQEDKTAYVVQNTTADNISSLFESDSINVFGTDIMYNNDDELLLRIGCEANEKIFE